MPRTGAANLPGALPGMVSGTDDSYWNRLTPAALLGVNTGTASKAAGQGLPPVTASYGDMQQVWWHPDSPTFWVVGLAVLTVFGMAAADVRVRLFKGRAGANVGQT